jgi:hypothetical protein
MNSIVKTTVKTTMATAIPPEITTPDTVETRLGTLKFFDGLPDQAPVEKVYDNLDFMRGVDVFLNVAGTVRGLVHAVIGIANAVRHDEPEAPLLGPIENGTQARKQVAISYASVGAGGQEP